MKSIYKITYTNCYSDCYRTKYFLDYRWRDDFINYFDSSHGGKIIKSEKILVDKDFDDFSDWTF